MAIPKHEIQRFWFDKPKRCSHRRQFVAAFTALEAPDSKVAAWQNWHRAPARMNRFAICSAMILAACLPLPASAHERDLRVGRKFPAIYLPSLDGKVRSIESFRGRKLILHVFASW